VRILFLDDNEDRHAIFRKGTIGLQVDHVYNAQEAIERLDGEEVKYDIIFLDHDLNHETENQLNDEEEDGRFVARHLAGLDRYKQASIILHSLNEAGRLAMLGILAEAGFSYVVPMPFAWRYIGQNEDGQLEIDPNR
jgi:CheY-like chemotaxis protein